MLTSVSLIFLVGFFTADICKRLKLPGIIGMLATGIILGPFVLNLIDPSVLSISADLRKIALIIILIKAGLSLDLSDLKKAGRPAVLLSFLPATFEIVSYILLAPLILKIDRIDAAIMGAVLAAVSPAVVVPRMINLIENKYGTDKAIPQMILAGSSIDDIFVIVLFTTFINMAQGGEAQFKNLLNIPVSIVLGIILGAVVGYILYIFFERAYDRDDLVRNSKKVIIILGLAFLLVSAEEWLKNIVAVSGLLAVVSMASVLRIKTVDEVSERLAEKYGKLWIGAEVLLFVLVGATVDIKYFLVAGVPALLMIFLALIFRAVGVILSTTGTHLTFKEQLFCIIAYLPKATVQAAIGSVPLSLGLPCGKIVLSVAVMGIIVTAPLGALGMDGTYKKLLQVSHDNSLEI